jgi:hypothetical protein
MLHEHSAEEVSYLATSFAVALANDMDTECIRVMCSFFVSVVGTLNLILAQRSMLKEKCKPEKPKPKPEPPPRPGPDRGIPPPHRLR